MRLNTEPRDGARLVLVQLVESRGVRSGAEELLNRDHRGVQRDSGSSKGQEEEGGIRSVWRVTEVCVALPVASKTQRTAVADALRRWWRSSKLACTWGFDGKGECRQGSRDLHNDVECSDISKRKKAEFRTPGVILETAGQSGG